MNLRKLPQLFPLAVLLGVSLLVAPALAHRVTLEMRDTANRPVDGEISLTGKAKRKCRTRAGSCSLDAPAGSYKLNAKPRRGGKPKTRNIKVKSGSSRFVVKVPKAPRAAKGKKKKKKSSTAAKGKNLGKGKKARLSGRITDTSNRPVDARLTFSKGKKDKKKVFGYCQTRAGSFTAYDLAPGTYKVHIAPRRGKSKTYKVKITKTKKRVIFKIKP
jgi:hypothetical protein